VSTYEAVPSTKARMLALAKREGRKLYAIVNEACLAYLAEKRRSSSRPSAREPGALGTSPEAGNGNE